MPAGGLALGAVAAGSAGAGAGLAGAGAAAGGAGAAGAAGGLSGLTSMLGKGGGGIGGGMKPDLLSGGPIGIALGALQNLQANKLKNQANAAVPGFVDPNQSAFLAELAQKRKSIDTGADFAVGMNTIDSTNAGTNEAIVRSTGGDVGGTIQALLQSQGMANQAKNNVLAQGQQQQMQYNQMYGSLLNRIEDRKLQLQMYRSQQARAEWAKKQQQANQNMMAGLARASQQGTGTQESPRTEPVGLERERSGSTLGNPLDLSVLNSDVNSINAQPIDDAGLNMGQIA